MTAETELRWSELKRAADFFDLLPEGTAIEAHLGKLEEGDRRKVVGLARWFIATRAEERERCAKMLDGMGLGWDANGFPQMAAAALAAASRIRNDE